MTDDDEYWTAYETCWKCGGSGLEDGMNGPVGCFECKGDCMIRVRDEHGRFGRVRVTFGSQTA